MRALGASLVDHHRAEIYFVMPYIVFTQNKYCICQKLQLFNSVVMFLLNKKGLKTNEKECVADLF